MDPVNIPIPNSENEDADDELYVEDQWIQRDKQIIRLHNKPRNTLFNPTTCEDCPVNVLLLKEECTTWRYDDRNHAYIMHHTDSWDREEVHQPEEHPWTGATVFDIEAEAGRACADQNEHDLLCLDHEQCLACEVFLTSRDLQDIQARPHEMTALISSAAKRQRAEVKIQELTPSEAAEFQQAKTKEIDQWRYRYR